MFLLLLSLVVCIGRAKVELDLDALKNGKIKLTGLNVNKDSLVSETAFARKQVDTYTFEPDAWMVIKRPDHTQQFQFLRQETTKGALFGKLVFQNVHKNRVPSWSIAEFVEMVEKFQVFVPVTPLSKAEELKKLEDWKSEYGHAIDHQHFEKWGEMLSVEKGEEGRADIPGRFTIGRIVSPWQGKRTFVAFDPTARGMFMITDHVKRSGQMYEFLGIDLHRHNKLVFLEAGTHDSVRGGYHGPDGPDAPTAMTVNPIKHGNIKFKIWTIDQFVALIRKNEVAVPVQNVGMDDYFVEYRSATIAFNSDQISVGAPVERNYRRGKDPFPQARAREDADYYRYGGYAYDGERDYAYDYYEDEEEDEEYVWPRV